MEYRYRLQRREAQGWRTLYQVALSRQVDEFLPEVRGPDLEVRVVDTKTWSVIHYEPGRTVRQDV